VVLLDVSMDYLDGWQTAELIRADTARGGDVLPIIFVSANVFENKPEQLAALNCQGFVGKPVIESELLAVLARALQLEWLHQSVDAPAGKPPEKGITEAPDWPADLRGDLLRMARLGHAQGLRALLQAIAHEQPGLAAACSALQLRVAEFDFNAVISALQEPRDALA